MEEDHDRGSPPRKYYPYQFPQDVNRASDDGGSIPKTASSVAPYAAVCSELPVRCQSLVPRFRLEMRPQEPNTSSSPGLGSINPSEGSHGRAPHGPRSRTWYPNQEVQGTFRVKMMKPGQSSAPVVLLGQQSTQDASYQEMNRYSSKAYGTAHEVDREEYRRRNQFQFAAPHFRGAERSLPMDKTRAQQTMGAPECPRGVVHYTSEQHGEQNEGSVFVHNHYHQWTVASTQSYGTPIKAPNAIDHTVQAEQSSDVSQGVRSHEKTTSDTSCHFLPSSIPQHPSHPPSQPHNVGTPTYGPSMVSHQRSPVPLALCASTPHQGGYYETSYSGSVQQTTHQSNCHPSVTSGMSSTSPVFHQIPSCEDKADTNAEEKSPKPRKRKRKSTGRPRGRPKGSVKMGAPKRPLSAYNLFFKDEREKILKAMALGIMPDGTKENVQDSSATTEKKPASSLQCAESKKQVSSNQGGVGVGSTGGISNSANGEDGTDKTMPIVPQNGKKKRGRPRGPNYYKKRSPHGKISFEKLAKIIAPKWKRIDPDMLAKYQKIAAQEKIRYRSELDTYERKERAKLLATSNEQETGEIQVDLDADVMETPGEEASNHLECDFFSEEKDGQTEMH